MRCRLWSDRILCSQRPLLISLTASCSPGRGRCLQCLAGPQLVVLLALGPLRRSLQHLGVRWGRRRGRDGRPKRADPTSALAHLCVLSLSLFQSGRQKPSVRGTLERTDCRPSVHLPTQLDNLSIQLEPSADCWERVGVAESVSGTRFSTLPLPFSSLAILEVGGGTQEDGALGLRVLKGLFGGMRLTHGG